MDLNEDGRGDILSGSYSRMGGSMAGLFQVLWGDPEAVFQDAEPLTGTDGEPLIIPPDDDKDENGGVSLATICTRPTAVDWDGDGDLDLIVGNFGGTFYQFVGEGAGKFQPVPKKILSDGQSLGLSGYHSDPFPVDWDGDGDLDLLSGSSEGGVQWAENTAGPGAEPTLKPFARLIAPAQQVSYGEILRATDLIGPVSSTRIWVDDVNDDGKLDVLVGDSVTLNTPVDGISDEECREKLADWTKRFQKASRELQALRESEDEAAPDEDASGVVGWLGSLFGSDREESALELAETKYSEIYQARDEFVNSEMTGFVWVYLQK